MGYLSGKVKKEIQEILVTAAVLLLAVSAGGCGTETAAGGPDAEESVNIDVASSRAEKDVANTADREGSKDTGRGIKVPVYGKKQKGKIIKYLSSLPDKMTAEEAEKRGIVIAGCDGDEQKRFEKEWMDFYKYTRAGEKQYSPKYGELICYSEPFDRRAITILAYTVEGDACYTYLSFVKGRYYMLEDSSRDSFRDSSWDGYGDLMAYKSLRKYKKPFYDEEGKFLEESTQFYLFKEQDITRKKANKIIGNPDMDYYDDYYNVFEYDT